MTGQRTVRCSPGCGCSTLAAAPLTAAYQVYSELLGLTTAEIDHLRARGVL